MDAPTSVLKERASGRGQGERFDNLDEAFLERVRAGYLWEAKQRNLPVVFATDTEEQVSNSIWNLVSQSLALREPSKATTVSEPVSVREIISQKELPAPHEPPIEVTAEPVKAAAGPLVEKDDQGRFSVTEAGQAYLSEAVTNTTGNVYAFTDKLSPVTIAAAMARLSRRGDDMRVTILDEFANKADKDAQLLQRVITAYGDDSVQQLAGLHLVVENASCLLMKELE